jgi:hypothetical protein
MGMPCQSNMLKFTPEMGEVESQSLSKKGPAGPKIILITG